MIDATKLGEALLAATFETTIAKTKTFQLSLGDFPIEAAVAFMQYGIGRKFNDAVGGADKDAATKVGLAEAMIADWKAGKIGRQAAVRVPDELRVRRTVMRELLRVAASTEQWEAFKALEADKQAERLDAIFDKQNEAKKADIAADVQKRIKAEAEKREQAAKLGAGISL